MEEMFTEKLDPHLQRMVDAGVNGLDIMHGHLKILMLEADAQLTEAQRIEEENDYDDAMESMERKYWEGMSDAYTHLYKLTYDLSFAIAGMEKPE
jgi:HPt (histidine-containing phosphotransfer) domain-containing protein